MPISFENVAVNAIIDSLHARGLWSWVGKEKDQVKAEVPTTTTQQVTPLMRICRKVAEGHEEVAQRLRYMVLSRWHGDGSGPQ